MVRPTETLKGHFVRGALGTGVLGVIHKVSGLLLAIVLARTLGAEGYGYYAFAIAVTAFLAVPAQLGLPQLVTRELATSHALHQWDLMRGLRRRALQLATIAAFATIFVGGILLVFSNQIPAIDPATFGLALALLPLMIFMEVIGGILRGLRKVIHAMWPMAALKPVIFLGLLLLMIWAGVPLQPSRAILVNLIATATAIVALTILLLRHWPSQTRLATPNYNSVAWLKSLLPFSMLAAANILMQKIDLVMLGMLGTPSDVGIYNVVVQGAMLVSFGFMALNSVLSPNIARFYTRGDTDRLQRLLATTSAIIFGIALAVMIVLTAVGETFLQFVFGDEFKRGYFALVILGCGQLVNASVGSVGTFLSMTGHEKDTLRAIVTAAIVNVVLNGLLIPVYGLTGAAIATMTATILWNVMMAIAVYNRLGLIPGPIQFRNKYRG